ncbi:MAG: acetoin utilization protein AcuC [Rhabdochlamydiaceae bacterium]
MAIIEGEEQIGGCDGGKEKTPTSEQKHCTLGVSFGDKSTLYSFPSPHPFNESRLAKFSVSLSKLARERKDSITIVKPALASEDDLLLFHTKDYVDFVKKSSQQGEGFLDYGDTPSYKGVYEASLLTVGGTLLGLEGILQGSFDHFFNPVGGLHHARRDRAGGFCVFDDSAIAIVKSLQKFNYKRVAYVDIDCHHGDGVFYGFESDKRVIIGDIHEDGRYLYPGTGSASEAGKGEALGTKLNIPLLPGAKDEDFIRAFDRVEDFVTEFGPEFIFLQCGADGLAGDPITHLQYTSKAHAYASRKLHALAHKVCAGRILAMGGGGYNAQNVSDAWSAVVSELSSNCFHLHLQGNQYQDRLLE